MDEHVEEKDRIYFPEFCFATAKRCLEERTVPIDYESTHPISNFFLGFSRILRNSRKSSYAKQKALGQLKSMLCGESQEDFVVTSLIAAIQNSNPPHQVEEILQHEHLLFDLSQLLTGAEDSQEKKETKIWLLDRLINNDLTPEQLVTMEERANNED